MNFGLPLFAIAACGWLAHSSLIVKRVPLAAELVSPTLEETDHPRALVARQATSSASAPATTPDTDNTTSTANNDRGTFNFDCSASPLACNNACYAISKLDIGQKLFFDEDSDDNDAKNRAASGCENQLSVCRYRPFSQKFADPSGYTPDNNGETGSTCDEWPPAVALREDDDLRNSLRCIPAGDNSSGGSQLKNFLSPPASGGGGRNGDQKFKTGDFYQIAFTNIDQNKSPFCPNGNNGAKTTTNDGFQFQVTRDGTGFKAGGPAYNYNSNNRYGIAGGGDDVAQCRLHVKRELVEEGKDDIVCKFTVTPYDQNGKAQPSSSANVMKGDPLMVTGLVNTINVQQEDNDFSDLSKDIEYNIEFGTDTISFTSREDFKLGGSYCSVAV